MTAAMRALPFAAPLIACWTAGDDHPSAISPHKLLGYGEKATHCGCCFTQRIRLRRQESARVTTYRRSNPLCRKVSHQAPKHYEEEERISAPGGDPANLCLK